MPQELRCVKYGERFGRLLVEEQTIPKAGRYGVHYLCRCDCGNYIKVPVGRLLSGRVVSCGCYGKEMRSVVGVTHGDTHTRLYNIWRDMKRRCFNSKSPMFNDYGGRGITICDVWKSDYAAFKAWATANGYSDDLTIDRIDNDGNYCPENCRWATRQQQRENERHRKCLYKNGERFCIKEAVKETDLKYSTVCGRLGRLGWSLEKALSTPARPINHRKRREHATSSS